MTDRTDRDVHGREPIFWLVLGIALFVAAWALKASASVVIPVIVSFFLAIALAPVDEACRARLPHGARWIGHAVSMLILILILGAFFVGIGMAARQVAEKFPGDFSDVGQIIGQTETPGDGGEGASDGEATGDGAGASEAGEGASGGGASTVSDGATSGAGEAAGGGQAGGVLGGIGRLKDELGDLVRERGTSYAGVVLNRTASVLASLVLILFLTLLLLIEGARKPRPSSPAARKGGGCRRWSRPRTTCASSSSRSRSSGSPRRCSMSAGWP